MLRMYMVLVGVSFCVAACGSDLNLGGPFEGDAGDEPSGCGGDKRTRCAVRPDAGSEQPGDVPEQDSENAPTDPREQAAGYSEGPLACQVDSDCCVVTDPCKSAAYVVTASDRETVRGLLDSADEDLCFRCIAPFVQVVCENNQCVGTELDLSDPDSDPDPRLSEDHCGSLAEESSVMKKGMVFGCGG